VVRAKEEAGELGPGDRRPFKIEGIKGGRRIVLKRSMEHLSTHTVSEEQASAMERAGGLDQTFYVSQVINLIEGDLLDRDNEKPLERLRCLRNLLVHDQATFSVTDRCS
jgi:hypothetical protein